MANYGFFNSDSSNPILYDADDFNKIFSGVINDGIYEHIGGHFAQELKDNGDGTKAIVIDTGKCWFKNKWFENLLKYRIDYPGTPNAKMTYEAADFTYDRYFAVVIEVNYLSKSVGFNILLGQPSENPQKPEAIINDEVCQMIIGYYYQKSQLSGVTVITMDEEVVIGSSKAPWVTSILEITNIDNLYAAWKQEWNVFYKKQAGYDSTDESGEPIHVDGEFDKWFKNLKNQLDTNQAAHLQNEIDEINRKLGNISNAEDGEY